MNTLMSIAAGVFITLFAALVGGAVAIALIFLLNYPIIAITVATSWWVIENAGRMWRESRI